MEGAVLTVKGITRKFITIVAPRGWITPNIAFYESSSTSNTNSIAIQIPPGTFFPTFGVKETNVNPQLDASHYKGYIKKLKLKSLTSTQIYDWMYYLLINYFNYKCSKNGLDTWENFNPTKMDEPSLRILSLILNEFQIIHYILINYFTHAWQLCVSIFLADIYGKGYWIQNLEFSDYVKAHLCPSYKLDIYSPFVEIDNDDEIIEWLTINHAQSPDEDITPSQIDVEEHIIKLDRPEHIKMLSSLTRVTQQLDALQKLKRYKGGTRYIKRKLKKRKSKKV
jgi:hypothetical protein